MNLLLQSYSEIPDPLVRLQFQNKIADLLTRNQVQFGADSTAFMRGVASMLDSKDAGQIAAAKALLVRLVQADKTEFALVEARQIARQYQAFQAQAAAGR